MICTAAPRTSEQRPKLLPQTLRIETKSGIPDIQNFQSHNCCGWLYYGMEMWLSSDADIWLCGASSSSDSGATYSGVWYSVVYGTLVVGILVPCTLVHGSLVYSALVTR